MKKILVLIIVSVIAFSCKTATKNGEIVGEDEIKENFPEEMSMIFARHGGIDVWRNAKTLSFSIGEEVHTSDLKTRKIIINSPNYTIGFDGEKAWKTEKVKGSYKENEDFYYNLYFYFYAMPFVLADAGIVYQQTDSLHFDGKKYPGIKISYKENIGTSPEDNYIIYYNSDNYRMEWLAYTVTFKTKKSNDKYNLIRYNDWETVNELVLPKSITWYNKAADGQPIEPAREPVQFTSPLLSQNQLEASFFENPVE